jgi:hypothetical protein
VGLEDLPEVEISMMRMMRICRLVENRFLMESFWSLRRLEKRKKWNVKNQLEVKFVLGFLLREKKKKSDGP